MSSYSCVVPVNWTKLTQKLIPAWCDLLEHRVTPRQFTEKHIPRQGEALRLWVTEFDRQCADIPATYLHEIGWRRGEQIFLADLVRQSSIHAALSKESMIATTTALLCAAIKQNASVMLSGEDPFEQDQFFSYYGRVASGLQVAGTKNQFHFLEGGFSVNWLGDERQWKSSEYQYQEKGTISQGISELLSSLFLAKRTLPAMETCEAEDRWPGTDDETIQGYLTPGEVTSLSDCLIDIASLKEASDDKLFQLFSNRVQRTSRERFGLVTLHAGLFGDW